VPIVDLLGVAMRTRKVTLPLAHSLSSSIYISIRIATKIIFIVKCEILTLFDVMMSTRRDMYLIFILLRGDDVILLDSCS